MKNKKTAIETCFTFVESEQTVNKTPLPDLQKQMEKGRDVSPMQLALCKQHILNLHQSLQMRLKQQLRYLLEPIRHQQAQLKLGIIEQFSSEQALTEANEQVEVIKRKNGHQRESQQKETALAKKTAALHRGLYNLSRLAIRPDSKLWHIAVAIFLILIESIGNGFFLAQGLDGGFLAGIVQAFSIAAISVYISYSAGVYLVPRLFDYRLKYQLLAGSLLVVFTLFIVSYHLSVGHLRIALAVDPDHAYKQAILRMLEIPFQLNSFDSVMLLILGLVFSATAVIAGAKADDLVPGFGATSERVKTAERNEHDLKMAHIAEVDHAMRPVLENARASLVDHKRDIAGQFLNGQLNARKILAQYELAIDALNNSLNHCLALYAVFSPEEDLTVEVFDTAALESDKKQVEDDDLWFQELLSSIKQAGLDNSEFTIKISHLRNQAIEEVQNEAVGSGILIPAN